MNFLFKFLLVLRYMVTVHYVKLKLRLNVFYEFKSLDPFLPRKGLNYLMVVNLKRTNT